jgi:hypothetical protein
MMWVVAMDGMELMTVQVVVGKLDLVIYLAESPENYRNHHESKCPTHFPTHIEAPLAIIFPLGTHSERLLLGSEDEEKSVMSNQIYFRFILSSSSFPFDFSFAHPFLREE